MIILDTNVISEAFSPRPERKVTTWLDMQPISSLFTTTITEAELFKGIELMSRGRKRDILQQVVEQYLAVDMKNQILPFDSAAARLFGVIPSRRKAQGRPITPLDTQIAAIAFAHNAILATRNTRDFEGCGIQLINPWEAL